MHIIQIIQIFGICRTWNYRWIGSWIISL